MKETRRQIHETKGSFYIYLPKHWIRKHGIQKDVVLNCVEFFDGSLLLGQDPPEIVESSENEVLIPASELNNNFDLLGYYIVGSYIIGANSILVKSKKKLSASLREEISRYVRLLPGFEIVEEENNLIRAKEIGQLSDINSIIQTLFSTTLVMLKALVELELDSSIDEIKREIKAVQNRDDDIDRFRYMIDRLSHQILSDPFLGLRLKLHPVSCLHFSQIASQIERIGDHCVEITKIYLTRIDELKVIIENIKEPLNNAIKSFKTLSKTYDKGKYQDALEIIKKLKSLEEEMKETIHEPEYGQLNYHISRILSYCSNINEIILDQTAYDLFMTPSDDTPSK